MTRTTQGGSVRNFIVVAVLLIGVIVAGVYILKQQQAQQPEPQPNEGVMAVEEESQPEEQTQTPVQELPGGSSVATNELPQTGMAENIGAVFAAGVVAAVIVYYFRSRQPELSL